MTEPDYILTSSLSPPAPVTLQSIDAKINANTQILNYLVQKINALPQTLGEIIMAYARTIPQVPHIAQLYIDSTAIAGHQAEAATNPIPAPASGIDLTLVTFVPSSATHTVTLPSVASAIAASPSGIGQVQIKELAAIGYGGVLPAGSDTIDGNTGTFAPTNGDIGPGGLMTFTTNGATGWLVG